MNRELGMCHLALPEHAWSHCSQDAHLCDSSVLVWQEQCREALLQPQTTWDGSGCSGVGWAPVTHIKSHHLLLATFYMSIENVLVYIYLFGTNCYLKLIYLLLG